MERRAYLMRLKQERIADYVEVHRKERVWRSVVDCLVRSGTTRMIILLHGQDVILFEEAHDLQQAYQVQNGDRPTQRWEAMISELMEVTPQFDAIRGDLEFREVPIVFHLENGKLLHD